MSPSGKKRRSKADKKVTRTRNLFIGFIGAIAIGIIGFGLYLSSGISDRGDATAGRDYEVIENSRPGRPGGPIEVVEFFSYRCGACKNFEPILNDWLEEIPQDVRFRRQHVVFSPIDELYSKTHLALESTDSLEQNHARMFAALQDQARQFSTPDQIGDFLDGRGVTQDEFTRAFNSPKIKRQALRSESDQRQFGVAYTPTLIIAGKYRVEMGNGQRRALVVADQLIEKERTLNVPAD